MNQKYRASFNGFHFDSSRGLSHGARQLPLRPKELAVLGLLLQRAGALVSKEELATAAWNGGTVSDESIARCICAIKARLREASPGADVLVRTEYARGYRFAGNVVSSHGSICEEGFQVLIDASPDLISLKDEVGRWLVVNRAGIALYGLEGRPWQGKTAPELAALSPPGLCATFQTCAATDEAAWEARQPRRTLETLKFGDEARILEVIKSPIFNHDGSRRLLVTLGRDVTERTRAEDELRLSAQVLANSSEAVMITDADNNILSVNQAFTAVTGYATGEVIGRNPRFLSSGRHDREFYQAMRRQMEAEGAWRGEIWNRDKSGKVYPEWLNISTVRDREGRLTHHIGIFSDITQRKAIEEQLEFLASHDPLTRLPNRLLLRDRFDQAIAAREGSLVALLFLDLDQFRNVNDTLGHEIGDRLLLEVAERLAGAVGNAGTIGRLGGDEFVILLPGLQDTSAASVTAQRVLDLLSAPFQVGAHALNTSFSIGIGLCPDDGTDFDSLLKLAEAAMYHAKDCGRNTYRFYTEQMNIRAREWMELRHNLHQALEQQQFVLHYQPQFELGSGKLVGVEALIRWQSPELGMVSPGRFIRVAEDSGLIVPIGAWVLHEGCRQNRRWQEAGFEPFAVAINLSARQFMRGDLVATVRQALDESGLEPCWLELELTESILIQDTAQVLGIVRSLKEIGVRLSIDDFGTGYSSLTYLKRFAVDKLKVDQSFVRNMAVDPDDAAIVHSVIQLGHSLKLKIVAEGVETREQAEYLRQEGCDQVQGYLYSHPVPADAIAKFLKKTEPLNKTID